MGLEQTDVMRKKREAAGWRGGEDRKKEEKKEGKFGTQRRT